MFDIGFSELLVIGVVALIVIGPERLPKVARTVGAWMGRLNRYVADVKGDIDREMRLDELRKLQDEMKASVQKYEIMADETGREIKREVEQVDKVMQAMAVTDGGLALREYENSKNEAGVAGEVAETASPEPVDSAIAALDEAVPLDDDAANPAVKPQDQAT